MSSVQHRRSSSGFWKSKNRDVAVEEIIRERKATIMSGKLKGRRLFKAPEKAAEVESDWKDDEMCSDFFNILEEREVNNENLKRNQEDLSSHLRLSCSSLPDENVEISETAVVEGEAGGGIGSERCMLGLIWFAIVSMLFILVLGLIISMSCSDKYVIDKAVILVPT